jgi:hypothetical protein
MHGASHIKICKDILNISKSVLKSYDYYEWHFRKCSNTSNGLVFGITTCEQMVLLETNSWLLFIAFNYAAYCEFSVIWEEHLTQLELC